MRVRPKDVGGARLGPGVPYWWSVRARGPTVEFRPWSPRYRVLRCEPRRPDRPDDEAGEVLKLPPLGRVGSAVRRARAGRRWGLVRAVELLQRALGFAALGLLTLVPLPILVSAADSGGGQGFAHRLRPLLRHRAAERLRGGLGPAPARWWARWRRDASLPPTCWPDVGAGQGGEACQKGLTAPAQYVAWEGRLPGRGVAQVLPDGSEHHPGMWIGNVNARRDRLERAQLAGRQRRRPGLPQRGRRSVARPSRNKMGADIEAHGSNSFKPSQHKSTGTSVPACRRPGPSATSTTGRVRHLRPQDPVPRLTRPQPVPS